MRRRLLSLVVSFIAAGYGFYAILIPFHLLTDPGATLPEALPESRLALWAAPVFVPLVLLVVTVMVFFPVERPSLLMLLGYWACYLLPFVAAYLALNYRRILQRSRRSRGLCPDCGYDLRATPGRCPECGAAAAATTTEGATP